MNSAPAFKSAKRSAQPFSWFLHLRWLLVATQFVTLLILAKVLNLPIAFWPLALASLLTVGSNLLLSRVGLAEKRAERSLKQVIFLDVFLLTLLLYSSGGSGNPFSILYLLSVIVAAILLSVNWALFFAGLTAGLFGLLFFISPNTGGASHLHLHSDLGAHLLGMWVAYAFVAVIAALCVSRLSRQRNEQEREAERLRLSQQRLASLTTLTAGVAHELSAPLSSIAIAAGELSRQLERGDKLELMREDVRLIAEEVQRAKTILQSMGENSGEMRAEDFMLLSLAELAEQLTLELELAGFGAVRVMLNNAEQLVRLSPQSLFSILKGLLKNSLQSGSPPEEITLAFSVRATELLIEITDRGQGMTPEVQSRAGEPFFSTKDTGQGMGLGLYLARLTAEQLGGSLQIESVLGEGSRVCLRLAVLTEAQEVSPKSRVSNA